MEQSIIPDLQVVAQQIHDIYIATVYESQKKLLDGYHQIGQLIIALPSKYEAVSSLSRLSKVSKRTLYRCAQFVEKYPQVEILPDNTSWTQVVTKYLSEKEEPKECEHEWIEVCKHCGKRK